MSDVPQPTVSIDRRGGYFYGQCTEHGSLHHGGDRRDVYDAALRHSAGWHPALPPPHPEAMDVQG